MSSSRAISLLVRPRPICLRTLALPIGQRRQPGVARRRRTGGAQFDGVAFHDSFQRRGDIVGTGRLGNEAVRTVRHDVIDQRRIVHHGDGDDRRQRQALAQRRKAGACVEAGKQQVQQDQVEPVVVGESPGHAGAVADLDDDGLGKQIAQHHRRAAPEHRMIVDQQDFHASPQLPAISTGCRFEHITTLPAATSTSAYVRVEVNWPAR